jgi:hypothetical protein
MIKRSLFLILAFSFIFGSQALQANDEYMYGQCTQNLMTELFYQRHPDARPENNPAYQALSEFTQKFILQRQWEREGFASIQAAGPTLTIPIVFHIIHQNGEENISDAQVMSALQALNEDYSDTNPNRGDLVAAFQGLEGFTDVVFAFPTKDPDGNPTTGITRHYDPNFVNGDDIAMKELYGWPRHMYLNIYVVYSASGGSSSGFSYLPADVDDWPIYDGVVLSHWACGTIGTAIPSHYRLISHEVGHWANLYHTWGDTARYGTQRACRQDDLVDDTPNCVGFWGGDPDGGPDGCNTDHTSCNSLDMIQNHMDYSFCPIVFTIGQSDRMRAALFAGVSERNNLWSQDNLVAVGLADPPPSLDIFVYDITMSLTQKGKNWKANATITIHDETGNPVANATVSVDWSGLVTGSDSDSTGADGTVTFTSPQTRNTGTFTITITNVTHSFNTYNPAMNVETADSISN